MFKFDGIVQGSFRIRSAIDALAVEESDALVQSKAITHNSHCIHLHCSVIGDRPLFSIGFCTIAALAKPVIVFVFAQNLNSIK